MLEPGLNPPPLLPLRNLIDELGRDAAERYAAKEARTPLGPLSGMADLDDRLGGAFCPGLHILHGSPGSGKTAFALQAAADAGCPALFVTCEMTPLELLRRIIARVTRTFLGKLKTGELPPGKVVELAKKAAATAPFLAILDATQQPATTADVTIAAETVRSLRQDSSHLLIVVDSLHSWADGQDTGGVPEYDRLNNALAALRALSGRLSVPVLAISERNRASMNAGGQSAGAGTRKIEYGAETVLELQAEAESEKMGFDSNGQKDVKLRISKNRNGETGGDISLRFEGRIQAFTQDTF